MDYKKIYDKIISNRIQSPLDDNEYGEYHHIIPLSIGGIDENSNVVKLSAREHFICHALLAEIYEKYSYEWYKMTHAFMMMKASNINQFRYFNSRLYESKKKEFSRLQSYNQSGVKNSQYGKVWIINKYDGTIRKVSKIEFDNLDSDIWMLGRILKVSKKENTYVFETGKRISSNRRNTILKVFNIDVYTHIGLKELHTLMYHEYVIENKSTVQISKKFGLSNPSVRLLLIDLGIGTKNTGGKW